MSNLTMSQLEFFAKAIGNIDWPLLMKQKIALIPILIQTEDGEGVLNLLDALTDDACYAGLRQKDAPPKK